MDLRLGAGERETVQLLAPDREVTTSSGVFVGIIGRPGAGKTTVTRLLARRYGLAVFRLREAVRAYPEIAGQVPLTTDPLGWLGVEDVRRTLQLAFIDGRFSFGRVVLLDNFPGSARQLELLTEVTGQAGGRPALLELRARPGTGRSRVAVRRVCLRCDSDPHAPALTAGPGLGQCLRCGGELNRRDSDIAELQHLRQSRYARNLPGIAATASERGIAHLTVDADACTADVKEAAAQALAALAGSALSDSSAGSERSRS